jgi:hypothetical protein
VSEQNVVDFVARNSGKRKKSTPFARLSKVLTEPELPLKANQRLVALVMFQHVDLETMQCFPSVDTIARRAKVSRHTVIDTIKVLQNLGLVKVSKKRTKGKFDRNVYDFSEVKYRTNRVPK